MYLLAKQCNIKRVEERNVKLQQQNCSYICSSLLHSTVNSCMPNK